MPNTYRKLPPALKAQWIEMLESGKFVQTTKVLHDNFGFCCLAVLLEAEGKVQWEDRVGALGLYRALVETDEGREYQLEGELDSYGKYLGLDPEAESMLILMNDGGYTTSDYEEGRIYIRPRSFPEIAQWIRENL